MVLFTITLTSPNSDDYSNRSLPNIRDCRCSMHQPRTLTSIIIVFLRSIRISLVYSQFVIQLLVKAFLAWTCSCYVSTQAFCHWEFKTPLLCSKKASQVLLQNISCFNVQTYLSFLDALVSTFICSRIMGHNMSPFKIGDNKSHHYEIKFKYLRCQSGRSLSNVSH